MALLLKSFSPQMYISANSLDDLLRRVLTKLLGIKRRIKGTRGELVEMPGILLNLKDPRARLSRTVSRGKVFSGLGELFWYLSGTNDVSFIEYYIQKYREEEENGVVWGGYGPRLFNLRGNDQISNVVNLLKHNKQSKRAVIQLFNAEDITHECDSSKRHKDIPCTCTLQFIIRDSKVNLITYMRSNDAIFGLPHDIFTFTMLQEIVARSLGSEMGFYRHCVGSLHLYKESFLAAEKFLEEGWQKTVSMPAMPFGSQDKPLELVKDCESRIRRGKGVRKDTFSKLDPYWADIVRLFQIYFLITTERREDIPAIKKQMHSTAFNTYIQRRQRAQKFIFAQEDLFPSKN